MKDKQWTNVKIVRAYHQSGGAPFCYFFLF